MYERDEVPDTIVAVEAAHESHLHRNDWVLLVETVGVDSGQAGIYDVAIYPEGGTGTYDDPTSFYGRACLITSLGNRWGVLDGGGVVSSTAYGDGTFSVFALLHGEYVVGLKIIFDDDFITDIEHNSTPYQAAVASLHQEIATTLGATDSTAKCWSPHEG